MTHTAGVRRAADHINEYYDWMELDDEQLAHIAAIIDEETHVAEMLAFVEKVNAWDFDRTGYRISQAQEEAFALLKKVKG